MRKQIIPRGVPTTPAAKRIVKLVITMLDGTSQDWELHLPIFCPNFDDMDFGSVYLEAFLLDMQRYYLKVKSYRAEYLLEQNGQRRVISRWCDAQEIPIKKVYLPNEHIKGQWLPYNEARQKQRERDVPSLKTA